MSAYVTRRTAAIGAFALDYGLSEIRANELARLWEYEGNRRGLDQRRPDFWTAGRTWMAEQVAAGVVVADAPTPVEPARDDS